MQCVAVRCVTGYHCRMIYAGVLQCVAVCCSALRYRLSLSNAICTSLESLLPLLSMCGFTQLCVA